MKRIKILDSLRGVASFIVLFHHVYTRLPESFASFPISVKKLFNIVSDLNVEAVIFFFILSGFSIRLSLRNNLEMTKQNLNDYLYRRFKRILPLYFLALILTFIVGIILHQTSTSDFSFQNLFGNIFFLQISKSYKGYWFSPYGNNGVLWSLPFEMFYYLFFPVFIFMLNKIFRGKIFERNFFIVSLVISFLISVAATGINKYFFFPYIAYATLFYCWYIGFFIAHLFMNNSIKAGVNFLATCVLCILFLIAYKFTYSSNFMKLFAGSFISCLMYFILILLNTSMRKIFFVPEKVINFIFYKIGKGSYALYLLHYPIVLLLMYFNVTNLLIVSIIFLLVILISTYLEEWLVKKKFLFFKINYLH